MKYTILTYLAFDLVTKYINNLKLNKIMAKQQEIVDQLNIQAAQLAKVKVEVLDSVEKLKQAVEAQDNASPELVAAAEAVGAAVQSIDEIIPDATTTETTQEESTTSSTTEEDSTTTETTPSTEDTSTQDVSTDPVVDPTTV